MKIASSAVNMSSVRGYTEKNVKEETLKFWLGNKRPDFEGNGTQPLGSGLNADVLDISHQAKTYAQKDSGIGNTEDTIGISDPNKRKLYLLQKLLEALTGKKIKLQDLEEMPWVKKTGDDAVSNPQYSQVVNQEPSRQGWGMEYDARETHYENEQVSFNAEGIIKTTDGKEINFTLTLEMSREYVSEQQIQIRAGDAKLVDPLVVNFDGTAAELTATKFSFDLNADGNMDEISFVAGNSGILTLDLNHDGKVNNGSELFGPNSGNGFAELAQYDQDQNNWIDENDAVYDQLKIWTKEADGTDKLASLKQKGVGAIYLGNAATLFSLKDSQNSLQGQVVKTGIYVKEEEGSAGTIQQVNLTI